MKHHHKKLPRPLAGLTSPLPRRPFRRLRHQLRVNRDTRKEK